MRSSFLFPRTFLLAGLLVAAGPVSAETDALRCAVVEVSSPQSQEAGERARRSRRYSATEILDLEISVQLPGALSGEHRLDVKVYTPDRQLYQVLTVPFQVVDEEPAEAAGRRRRETRRIQRERARFTRVTATLPVAGTSIVSSSLYGGWTATAFLDGSTQPCGRGANFVITE